MTANQIAYWNLQETKRSNQVRELETERSNRAKEFETQRSNMAKEDISWYETHWKERQGDSREAREWVFGGVNQIKSAATFGLATGG